MNVSVFSSLFPLFRAQVVLVSFFVTASKQKSKKCRCIDFSGTLQVASQTSLFCLFIENKDWSTEQPFRAHFCFKVLWDIERFAFVFVQIIWIKLLYCLCIFLLTNIRVLEEMATVRQNVSYICKKTSCRLVFAADMFMRRWSNPDVVDSSPNPSNVHPDLF